MSPLFYGVAAAAALGAYVVVRWLRTGAPGNIGDEAPPIRASGARHGERVDFDLHETLKKSAVILYFFPQAFTAG